LITLCGNLLVSAALWTLALSYTLGGTCGDILFEETHCETAFYLWTCELGYTTCYDTASDTFVQGPFL